MHHHGGFAKVAMNGLTHPVPLRRTVVPMSAPPPPPSSDSPSGPDSSPDSEPTVDSDRSDGSALSVAPTLTLPRWALPVGVISVIGFGLAVYSLFPDAVGGPPLPVRVEIEQALIETVGGAGRVPAEVVSVTNQAAFPIPHLVVVLNGHYRLDRQSPIGPGETLQLPQTIFTDKRSSRRFDPILQRVTKVVVNGQLPEGTRGVSVFRFDGLSEE